MNFAVAFISDREDLYLPACQASLAMNEEPVASRIVDDREHLLGMAGAVREAWTWAIDLGVDYLFHVEEDFVFNEEVDIRGMAQLLDADGGLAQVVLKRQPWSPEEQAAGGIIEANPTEYDGHMARRSEDRSALLYVTHTRIFSLNPCLIPRKVLELGWPDDNEAGFTRKCLYSGRRFAFYGARDDKPRCLHVGAQRGNGWRL